MLYSLGGWVCAADTHTKQLSCHAIRASRSPDNGAPTHRWGLAEETQRPHRASTCRARRSTSRAALLDQRISESAGMGEALRGSRLVRPANEQPPTFPYLWRSTARAAPVTRRIARLSRVCAREQAPTGRRHVERSGSTRRAALREPACQQVRRGIPAMDQLVRTGIEPVVRGQDVDEVAKGYRAGRAIRRAETTRRTRRRGTRNA